MTAETVVVYDGNLHCRVVHEPSQQEITTDAPADKGGKGESISPMDLFTSSLGACIATVVGMAAQRSKLDIAGMRVETFCVTPTINIRITLPRRDAPFSPAEIDLLTAATKSCPVKKFLHPDLNLVTEFVPS